MLKYGRSLLFGCLVVTVSGLAFIFAGSAVAITEDPPEDRPLSELFEADEITRSEMHNVIGPEYELSGYFEVSRNLRLVVEASDAEVTVVGKTRLDDEIVLDNGQAVIEGDVVVKGLLYNDSTETAEFLVVTESGTVVDTFTLDPTMMITVGDFVMDDGSPHSCTVDNCIFPGEVPCCWRDSGGNPQCNCKSSCPHNSSGGPDATGCGISKNGCSVSCASGSEACCGELDANGKPMCYCRPAGECPNNSGSGASSCSVNLITYVDYVPMTPQ